MCNKGISEALTYFWCIKIIIMSNKQVYEKKKFNQYKNRVQILVQ